MHTSPHRNRSLAEILLLCMLASGLTLGVACSGEDSAKAPPTSPGKTEASPPSTPSPAPSAPTPAPTPAEPSQDDLVAQGRSVYMGNCIACHSQNPSMDGALGPAVAGASYELLEARVMRGEYPPGYTPKRDSRVMIPLPHLKNQLPALAAYLGSFSES